MAVLQNCRNRMNEHQIFMIKSNIMDRNLRERKAIRWKEHSYNSSSYYFITICTFDRKKILSEIIDEQIVLSDIGSLVEEEWKNSFIIRKELSCVIYCIMPNHMHAIVLLNNDGDVIELENKFAKRVPKSLSGLISGFKSSVTSKLRSLNYTTPVWQTRFHDRIIRDHHEFRNIENYILENPLKWSLKEDEYF